MDKSPKSLLIMVGEGNHKAFSLLYNLFSSMVYQIALSYALRIEDAEEITQDVFVKVYHSASNFKGQSTVKTWIYRITINTALNYIKKKKIKVVDLDAIHFVPKDFNHPGILLEKKEQAKFLFYAIDQLKEQQKTAFILGYIDQLPRQEIADIMGISLKAVESLLQRAKVNIRKKLEKMFPNRRIYKNKWSK